MWETILTGLEKSPDNRINHGVKLLRTGYQLVRSSAKSRQRRAVSPIRHEPKKGMIAGLIGGLVASVAMRIFQKTWDTVIAAPRDRPSSGREPEAEKIAAAVSRRLFRHNLTAGQEKIAVPAVHYTVGAAAGAAYGTAVEYVPELATDKGLPFGAGMMALNDEIILPGLGLIDPPARQPKAERLFYLASHLVYGVTCELVRRRARRLLDRYSG